MRWKLCPRADLSAAPSPCPPAAAPPAGTTCLAPGYALAAAIRDDKRQEAKIRQIESGTHLMWYSLSAFSLVISLSASPKAAPSRSFTVSANARPARW